MTPEAPEYRTLAARLDAILDRLAKLELQVRSVVTSQTVEAKEFVVRDERRDPGPPGDAAVRTLPHVL